MGHDEVLREAHEELHGKGYMEPTHMPTIKPGEVNDWTNAPGRLMRLGFIASTELASRIIDKHLPEAMDHFLRRNAEYGDDDDFNLGSAGQYVDISRKVQKLKRRMWEGQEERYGEESTRTIVMELIGHLLMTMDYLEQEDGSGQG